MNHWPLLLLLVVVEVPTSLLLQQVLLLPPQLLLLLATQVDAYAELPYFMNPLLAACQLVNVSLPGSEPPLADAQEDMRLFSPALCDKNGKCVTKWVRAYGVRSRLRQGGYGGVTCSKSGGGVLSLDHSLR
jgi:hypothetical protein